MLNRKFEKNYGFGEGFQAPPPPKPHRSYIGPGGHPPFGLPPFFPPPPMGGPMPLGRKGFSEMKTLFILSLISEYPEGITVYLLHKKYKLSRGMLISTLEDLENEGYLKTREDEVKGRSQKYYIIIEKGMEYLIKLKSRWANRFARMSEMAPPEHFGKPFLHDFERLLIAPIQDWDSKEDAIDYLGGIRSWIKSMIRRIENRKSHLEIRKSHINYLIEKIKELNEWNLDEIKKLLRESFINNHKDTDISEE